MATFSLLLSALLVYQLHSHPITDKVTDTTPVVTFDHVTSNPTPKYQIQEQLEKNQQDGAITSEQALFFNKQPEIYNPQEDFTEQIIIQSESLPNEENIPQGEPDSQKQDEFINQRSEDAEPDIDITEQSKERFAYTSEDSPQFDSQTVGDAQLPNEDGPQIDESIDEQFDVRTPIQEEQEYPDESQREHKEPFPVNSDFPEEIIEDSNNPPPAILIENGGPDLPPEIPEDLPETTDEDDAEPPSIDEMVIEEVPQQETFVNSQAEDNSEMFNVL